jgi:hypothetical protein
VRPIVERVEFARGASKRRVISKGAQQLVVARASLVRSGNDRIDDAKERICTDALGGDTGACVDRSIDQGAVF